MAHHAEEKTSSATAVTPVNAHQPTIVNNHEHAASANSSMTPTTHQSNFIQHIEASANNFVTVSAVTAHQPKPVPVDLTTCESVLYEMRDRIPRVKYMKNGTEGWTPVVKRSRRRKMPNNDSGTCNSSSDTSESELDVSYSRMVQYSVRDGIPGVSIHRRNVIWKPVMPSPVSSRTRSRTNN